MIKLNKRNLITIASIILIGISSRLFPHLPNVTAILALSLFAGAYLPIRLAIVTLLLTQFGADICLAEIYHFPLLGDWTFFTYSSILLGVLLGIRLHQAFGVKRLCGYTLILSLSFWLWTNFGVWLLSGVYALNFSGLFACYTLALPFLRNTLIGNLCWVIVIFASARLNQAVIPIVFRKYAVLIHPLNRRQP